MGNRWSGLMMVLLLWTGSGCATAVKHLYPPSATDKARTVYVVSNGWHAGLVIRRDEIPREVWPEHLDLPMTEYAEIGWGNEEFYMTRNLTPAIVVRALCWPSDTVLHVAGFNGPPERVFEQETLISVR